MRLNSAHLIPQQPFWDYWFKAIYPKRDEAEVMGEVRIDTDY